MQIVDLPNELLTAVFRHAAVRAEEPTPRHTLLPQVAISQVCKHFRAIAIGDPLLWNSVRFGGSAGYRESLCELFIQRSHDTGLDINAPLVSAAECFKFSKLFTPHAHRWQSVAVSGPGRLLELDVIPSSPLPLLKMLKIMIVNNNTTEPLQRIPCLDAPKLKSLHLSKAPVDWATLYVPSVDELILMSYRSPLIGPSLKQLSQFVDCSQLRRLSVNPALVPDTPNEQEFLSSPLVFTRLAVLEMKNVTYDEFRRFWLYASAPRLDKCVLVIDVVNFHEDTNSETGQSFRTVNELQISIRGSGTRTVPASFSSHFPNLVRLHITPLMVLPEYWVSAVESNWPQLQYLQVGTIDLNTLKGSIEARQNNSNMQNLVSCVVNVAEGQMERQSFNWLKSVVDLDIKYSKRPDANGRGIDITGIVPFSTIHHFPTDQSNFPDQRAEPRRNYAL